MRVASAEGRAAVISGGLHPMPAEAALRVLGQLLGGTDHPQLAVASIDWERLRAVYEAKGAPDRSSPT